MLPPGLFPGYIMCCHQHSPWLAVLRFMPAGLSLAVSSDSASWTLPGCVFRFCQLDFPWLCLEILPVGLSLPAVPLDAASLQIRPARLFLAVSSGSASWTFPGCVFRFCQLDSPWLCLQVLPAGLFLAVSSDSASWTLPSCVFRFCQLDPS